MSLLSACDIISDWAANLYLSAGIIANVKVLMDNSRFRIIGLNLWSIKKDERHAYGFEESIDD